MLQGIGVDGQPMKFCITEIGEFLAMIISKISLHFLFDLNPQEQIITNALPCHVNNFTKKEILNISKKIYIYHELARIFTN